MLLVSWRVDSVSLGQGGFVSGVYSSGSALGASCALGDAVVAPRLVHLGQGGVQNLCQLYKVLWPSSACDLQSKC